MATKADTTHHRSCIIVGAGLSGLIQAAELVRKGTLPLHEILILEQRKGLGGVWRQATYPGAACDVKSHVYQINFHRNPEWSESFPTRNELLAYYQGFADKYGLTDITRCNTRLTSAEWDEGKMKWGVKTRNTQTEELTEWTTDILILATGVYREEYIPKDIPGFADYQGTMFHSSSWPDLDLTGKKVIYVGAGPTAVQAIPKIQPLVKDLTVIARSVAYCIPRNNKNYSAVEKFLFRNVPLAAWLHAQMLAFVLLASAYAFRPASFMAKEVEKMAVDHLNNQVKDPALREALRPYGRFGAKRPLVSDDFYCALQKENVHVVNAGISKFTAHGVIPDHQKENDSGEDAEEIKADVIILGTGFQMQSWGTLANVKGLTEESLSERLHRDPSCLNGIAIPHFPNLFVMQGPNSVMPWYSVPWASEMQATYIDKIIRHVKDISSKEGGAIALMATEAAASSYTKGLQAELSTLSSDRKYGTSPHYVDHEGRNTTFYPLMPWNYWWTLRRPDWSQFQLFRDPGTASS